MTDKEIIKALECCSCETIMYCEDQCPFYEKCMDKQLSKYVSKYALDLIKRQQAELERLKNRPYALQIEMSKKIISQIKAKAVKEFAERLKSLVNQHHYMLANVHNSRDFGMFTLGFEQAIDIIVEEMVDDKE